MTDLKWEVFFTKAFHQVWHKSIIFKLKENVISGKIISALSGYLKDGKQEVTLNGQVF